MRRFLHSQNPHCHWCGTLTLLIPEDSVSLSQRATIATIDHVKCRGEAKTLAEYRAKENKVLSCWKCNQQRNNEFVKANLGKPITFLPRKIASNAYRRNRLNPQPTFVGVDPYMLAQAPATGFTHY